MSDHETIRPWETIFTEYKEKFERENPVAFSILEIGGVHPDQCQPIPNPYLEGRLDNEDFRNVGRHCVEVGIVARKISDNLLKNGVIDQAVADDMVNRALIHDANKRYEVFRRKAKEAGKEIDVYSANAYDTMYQQVKAQGHSGPLVEYVKHAGKETGSVSLTDFIVLDNQGEPMLTPTLTPEELVVHLADDMVASPLPGKTKNTETKLVTITERMELGNFPTRYPFIYQEGFGFDENNQPILVKDVNDPAQTAILKQLKTYAKWQQLTARLICEQLKNWIGGDADQDAEELIKKIANN